MKVLRTLMIFLIIFTNVFSSDIYELNSQKVKFDEPSIYRIDGKGDTLVSVIIRSLTSSKSELESMGLIVHSIIPGPAGTSITGEIIKQDLNDLKKQPEIISVELSRMCFLTLNASSNVVRSGIGNTASGMEGDGVILGIVDTGIDLENSDFRNSDGTTRVIRLWDQTALSGTPPSGFADGAEYNSDDINDCILNGNCPQGGLPKDTHGHGTHVAGISVGNGNNNDPNIDEFYIGMAPKADLV